MFYYCNFFIYLILTNFNKINIIVMYDIFFDCCSLIILDLFHFNNQNIINIGYNFIIVNLI